MERLNIFEALNVANGDEPDDAVEALNSPEDALNFIQDNTDGDGRPVSGDDLTDEEEPDVTGQANVVRASASAEESDECAPESDCESDASDDYPFLTAQIQAIRQQRKRVPPRQDVNSLEEIGHLAESVMKGKDGTVWSSVPPSASVGRASAENVFTMPANQLAGCGSVQEPVDAFQLFMLVMSTMHHDRAVAPDAPKKKPDIVRFYNATKGAVDSLDQMAHAYSTKHITKRWPMVIFYNTVDLSTIAARVVWSIKFPDHVLSKKDARPLFILRVAEQLSLEHMERRLCAINLPKPLRNTVERHVQHLQQKMIASQDGGQSARAGGKRKRPASTQRPSTSKQSSHKEPKQKQGRCGSCSWKLDRKARKSCFCCSAWLCKEHTMFVCKQCADSITDAP